MEIREREMKPVTRFNFSEVTLLLLEKLKEADIGSGPSKEALVNLIMGYEQVMGLPQFVLRYAKANGIELDPDEDTDIGFYNKVVQRINEEKRREELSRPTTKRY